MLQEENATRSAAAVEKFIDAIEKRRSRGNSYEARRLYDFMHQQKLEAHPVLSNYLVPMLVECCSLQDACHAFNRIHPSQRNIISWTSLISEHINIGDIQRGFVLYYLMQEHLQPNTCTYVTLLSACCRLGDKERGMCLHDNILKRGLEMHLSRDNIILGNTLVHMYAKCGLLLDARKIFEGLPLQDIVTWNVWIAGCAERGHLHEVWESFSRMQNDGISPDSITHVCGLKACSVVKALGMGQKIHAESVKKGLEGEPFVVNALVDMYSKCKSLAEACFLSHRLPSQDPIPWAAVIAGYSENGQDQEVLACFKTMQQQGLCADVGTFILSLKACGTLKELETAQELHVKTVMRGFDSQLFLGNTTIDMYTNCNLILEARLLFDTLPVRDTTSWNVLIAGYVNHTEGKYVGHFFSLMYLEGVCPNAVTFACSLKACVKKAALRTSQDLHAEAVKMGLENDPYVGNSLIDIYSKNSLLQEAHKVLVALLTRDVVSWNALIAGYAEHGSMNEAISFLKKMLSEGIAPDAVTFISLLKSCDLVEALETGRMLDTETIKRGFEKDVHVGSSLVDMYINCGSIAEAQQVFSCLSVRSEVSWGVLLAGFVEYGLYHEAQNCFKCMLEEHVPLSVGTSLLCLKACASLGAIETGREIHSEVRKLGLERDTFVGSMLIDMYGKCGLLTEGREVFENLPKGHILPWNTMIKSYGENHQAEMAVLCYEDMQDHGVKPDSQTLVSILAACSHSSLMEQGQHHFEEMITKHGIEPTTDHYSCMIDLFARAGQLHEAKRLAVPINHPLSNLLMRPLLSGCQIYGEFRTGCSCFEQIMELNRGSAYPFVISGKYGLELSGCLVQTLEEGTRTG